MTARGKLFYKRITSSGNTPAASEPFLCPADPASKRQHGVSAPKKDTLATTFTDWKRLLLDWAWDAPDGENREEAVNRILECYRNKRQTLDLSSLNLSSLPPNMLCRLTHLRALVINNNQLKQVPETLLRGLTSLTLFSIISNELTSVPKSLFSGLKSLNSCNFSSNSLSTVPETLFQGLTALRQCRLDTNKLTDIPPALFRGVSNLERCLLSDNQLTSVPEMLCEGLHKLQFLTLNANFLSELPSLDVWNQHLPADCWVSFRNNWLREYQIQEIIDFHNSPGPHFQVEFSDTPQSIWVGGERPVGSISPLTSVAVEC